MPFDEVKKYRCVVRDRRIDVRYIIYSDAKLTKKEKMQQIRLYHLNKKMFRPDPGDRITIIAEC